MSITANKNRENCTNELRKLFTVTKFIKFYFNNLYYLHYFILINKLIILNFRQKTTFLRISILFSKPY